MNAVKLQSKKRFSTYLMITLVGLVTVSVVIILAALHFYVSKRVESEFSKKILAQKGQVEILLQNRIASIRNILGDLTADNIIRVTVALNDRTQLEERILQTGVARDGVYLFIKKAGERSFVPGSYPGLSPQLIDFARTRYPYGDFVEGKDQSGLLWWFSTLIMHENESMGTAYALYDMTQDHRLLETIQQTVGGDVYVLKSDQLFSMTSKTALPLDAKRRQAMALHPEFYPLDQNLVLSKINHFQKLYFRSSLEELIGEKKKLTLWLGLFSFFILLVSTGLSVCLAQKMVNPLKEMTRKAIQVSEGYKDVAFANNGKHYWEFNQLSQAFNYMLTNLKDAEEQTRYKELLENVDDAVYMLDQEGNILTANEAAYASLGYVPEVFFGLNLHTIVPERVACLIIAQLGQNGQGKNPQKILIETCHHARNGDDIPVEIHARAITYRGRHVILNVARDISKRMRAEQEKRELQAQLSHAQKMEAIGTLAGGVAHDFNNLLTAIQGYASLMRLKMAADHPFDRYVAEIERNVMNAANLTKQLLGFARQGKYSPVPTCLNDIVEKSSEIFSHTRKDINVVKKLQGTIWTVEADPGQIEQVLLNLYLNALHAMPSGGELHIQTENVTLDDDYCRPFEVAGGRYVNVSVTDTGAGMDEETMERIFEPFFTTKDVDKGTGLGLASAYGIVKNHSGFIRVYSQKGYGSTFNIFLPVLATGRHKDSQTGATLVKGEETILLVDDEDSAIQVEEVMLKELGYTVLTTRSGKEAVTFYEENQHKLDLVALDMMMPEMGGRETCEQLKQINPNVNILLVSAYSLNGEVEALLASGCKGFIQKPFDIVQLSQSVRAVLGQ